MREFCGWKDIVYTCFHCGHKMAATEANNAYDGCGMCRHIIDWTDWLDKEEIEEMEWWANEEREDQQRRKKSIKGWADSFE